MPIGHFPLEQRDFVLGANLEALRLRLHGPDAFRGVGRDLLRSDSPTEQPAHGVEDVLRPQRRALAPIKAGLHRLAGDDDEGLGPDLLDGRPEDGLALLPRR